MDVTIAPRPHSTTRPTQAYYVPRKLLECGRGPQSPKSENNEEKKHSPVSAPTPQRPKNATTPKPRPLMEQILSPPPSLKEKQMSMNRQKSNNYRSVPSQKTQKPRISSSTSSPRNPTSHNVSLSSPRDPYLIASNPSSRSSSSMSSTQLSPPLSANRITVSSPRVILMKGGPQKYSLPRPNPFAPNVIQSDEMDCICDRKNTHVVCKRCGYECVGRVQITCGPHPLVLALNDIRECPNPVCRSIQIVELECTADVHDDQIEQLAEPIQKIDLAATDE